MKQKKSRSSAKTATEDRVRNAIVGHIARNGYSNNLKIKSGDPQSVDISATHKNSVSRTIFIETKGNLPGCNKNLAIRNAWGQIMGRVTSLNAKRIHGLGFPKEWEKNVAKLSSPVVAREVSLRYYFVDTHGSVEESSAAAFIAGIHERKGTES